MFSLICMYTFFSLISSSTCQLHATRQPESQIWKTTKVTGTLQCAFAGKSNIEIQWLKNEFNLKTSNNIVVKSQKTSGETQSTLYFKNLTVSDNGDYQCVATASESRKKSYLATVQVFAPPVIVKGPVNMVTTLFNDSLTIPCIVNGYPLPTTIIWKYDLYSNSNKTHTGELIKQFSDGLTALPHISLAIAKNATKYAISCNVDYAAGSASSRTAEIILNRQPPTPSILGVTAVDHTATLRFNAGFKDLTTCFVKIRYMARRTKQQTVQFTTENTSLTFNQLTPKTNYFASVRCQNNMKVSNWSKLYRFALILPIGSPNNITISFLQPLNAFTDAVVTWSPLPPQVATGKLIGYRVELYNESDANASPLFVAKVSTTNVTLKNLSSKGTYSVHVCGYTAAGVGPYRAKLFSALVHKVPLSPMITDVNTIADGTIVTFDKDQKGNHPIKNCSTEVHTAKTSFNCTIGLTCWNIITDGQFLINYEERITIAIFCTNDIGNSKLSEPVYINPWRQERKIATKPQNIKANQVNNSSINVTWDYTEIESTRYFNVCLTAADTQATKCYKTSLKKFLLINEFRSGTSYSVRVAAGNTLGSGAFSNTSFIITDGNYQPPTIATETPNDKQSEVLPIVVAVVVTILFVLFVMVMVVVLLRRKSKQKQMQQSLTAQMGNGIAMDGASTFNDYYTPMSGQGSPAAMQELEEKLKDVLIKPDKIKQGKILGEGEFGFVFKGEVKIIDENNVETVLDVAVKSIKFEDCSLKEKELFIDEGLRMKGLEHPNVMHLVGISLSNPNQKFGSRSTNFSPLVVLPFMKNGDLKNYLFTMRNSGQMKTFKLVDLLKFGIDIARGMEYLSEHKFIHRDLAARNCMLDENMNAVVSDFGLSRQMYAETYYRQTHISKMPVKWMAIESLGDNIFTSMSDVWSFGVTMWEILTFCQAPYPGVSNNEMYELLRGGGRLNKPPTCNQDIWCKVVFPCWIAQSASRITFPELVERLQLLIDDPPEDALQPIEAKLPERATSGYEEVATFGTSGYDMAADNIKPPETVVTPLLHGADIPSTSKSISNNDSVYL